MVIRTVPDGRVATGTMLFGSKNRVRKFARYVARCTRMPAESLDVAVATHASEPGPGSWNSNAELRKVLDNVHRTTITDLGAALGVHGGPGTLIVATQPVVRP